MKRQSDKNTDSDSKPKKQKTEKQSELKLLPKNPDRDQLEKVTGRDSDCWLYFQKLRGHDRVYCCVENSEGKRCHTNYAFEGVRH